MKKSKKLTKKEVNLGGLSKKVFDSLCINPTTKYVIKKTGKSKESVGRVLKKLIQQRYIKRLGRGYYQVNRNKRALTQVNQNNEELTEREQQNKRTKDYFRMHFIQLRILLPDSHQKRLKNTVIKRKVFKNIGRAGNNGGYTFNVDGSENTYSVTDKHLFLYFSDSVDIKADTLQELDIELYNLIMEELSILESRFKIYCFKDGRVNFDITNMHIALVRNGAAEWLRKEKKRVVYYDEEDGKPRVITDFSNLLDELEAVHAQKGRDDAYELQKTMGYMAKGTVNDVVERGQEFFKGDNETTLSDLKKIVYDLANIMNNLVIENKETAAGLNSVVQLMKAQLPQEKEPEEPKGRPYYVG